MKKIIMVLVMMCSCLSFANASGFLRVTGKTISNDQGELILRGIGLGGWLVPEGYMLQTPGYGSPTDIRNKIVDLVGEAKADSFFALYRKNFVTRQDVDLIASWGFNSIRLPLHYNLLNPKNAPSTYLEEGFATIDSVLRWCEANHIYLILDLHCAHGGQNSANISDYISGQPSLWESEINRLLTIALWKKLAERYHDKEWIGGYDLLNETVWNLPNNNQALRELYISITTEIRKVDTTHIIFIEGNSWANDFTGLNNPWDEKLVYSFHKYWNGTDVGTINTFLNLRNSTNRPLWLGESGENSNDWFTKTITMLEANNVGWAWWTYKKIGAANSMLNVVKTNAYNSLLQYWSNGGTKPSADFAYYALLEQAEKLKLQNCQHHPDVVDAMFRQPHSNTRKPFASNIFPGKVFMVNYDLGGYGVAYTDVVYTNTTGSAGGAAWNNGGEYRNDGVDIEKCSDQITNGYDVGWTESNESLTFTFTVQQSGSYSIDIRVAANASGGSVATNFDGTGTAIKSITATGGWQSWQTQHVRTIDLNAGAHTMTVAVIGGGFNANYIEASLTSSAAGGDDEALPKEFLLSQNYPNPFNPATVITYQIPSSQYVSITIYDVLGKEISRLVNKEQNAGSYSVQFDAAAVPSGMYYYELRAGSFIQTKRMIVIK